MNDQEVVTHYRDGTRERVMNNLVERLRANPNYTHWLCIAEAADRIEELEAIIAADVDRVALGAQAMRIKELEGDLNIMRLQRNATHCSRCPECGKEKDDET